MRAAVLSDIHANLHAIQAVAKDVEDQRVDEIWSLGDVVGYGANPRETLAWVLEHADIAIKGNHDEAVATGDVRWFNPMAAQAARAHAQVLAPPERNTLYAWPSSMHRDVEGTDVLLVHASPDDPLHEYVQPQDARLALRRWEGRARIILLGHTHRPFAATLAPKSSSFPSSLGTSLGASLGASLGSTLGTTSPASRWRTHAFLEDLVDERAEPQPLLIVNPGSVGQPRDGDARASYAIVDFARRAVELRRVAYDVEAAAQGIIKEGLDQLLALRLYEGR